MTLQDARRTGRRFLTMPALMLLLFSWGLVGQASQPDDFAGTIGKTLQDSVPYWHADVAAPRDAPNILIWIIDDAGYSHLEPYGSPIATPNITDVANDGIVYSNFHTVPLCSPARAALLAGRNHHSISMGSHALSPMGFPGYYARIPENAGSIARILKSAGYATMALGKWDHLPAAEISDAGPFDRWPSGQGFERFYGFLAAEANHFGPVLWEDHAPVPPSEDQSYFLTTDLADKAIEYIGALQANSPEKPFFMYWATGAVHAPHHAPKPFIDRYSGQFDRGWDEMRKEVLAEQKRRGLVPADTELAPKQGGIPDWAALSAEERKLFTRQMEAFAGQLEHADQEFGRILDYLEAIGERDNTIVVILSDNGSSAEGGMHGIFNENLMFSGRDPTLEENMAYYNEWGGARTNNHFHAGWAALGNTPFPYFKHQVQRGGTQVPLVISWPAKIRHDNKVRSQYHHIIDIAPTLLEAAGIEKPEILEGVLQTPFDGKPMNYTFVDADAPSRRDIQYFEIWGNRGIWADGWEAATVHAGIMPWDFKPYTPAPFDDDVWELYDTRTDFSQSRDLAESKPQKLEELKALWEQEARRYQVYPLDADKTGRLVAQMNRSGPVRDHLVYVPPGGRRVPEPLSPQVKNRSHEIVVDLDTRGAETSGVVVTAGGATAGYALLFDKGVPVYVYNLYGLKFYELRAAKAPPAGRVEIRFEFEKTGEFAGIGRLYVNGDQVAEEVMPETVRGVFSVQEGFDVGMDNGTSVSPEYAVPFQFTGNLRKVEFKLL
jgi:arylsulfatase